jgi:hypothetical protein
MVPHCRWQDNKGFYRSIDDVNYNKLAQDKIQWLAVKTFRHLRGKQNARNLLTSRVSAYQVLVANSVPYARRLRHNLSRLILYTYMYICRQDQG